MTSPPWPAGWGPFLSIVASYWSLSVVIGHLVGWRGLSLYGAGVFQALELGLGLFVVVGLVFLLTRGWRRAARELGPLALRLAVIFGSVCLLSAITGGWRVSIPTVHPFTFGPMLDRWDVAIHGTRPWEQAHALLRAPWARGWLPATIDWTYSTGWFVANIVLLLALAATPMGPTSHRILVTYALEVAVLGALVAVCVSSAGPVYYGRIYSGFDPYAGLGPALRAEFPSPTVLGVLEYQDLLWRRYVDGNIGITSGITAFPSMHVAGSVLMALAAGAWARWAGVIGWLFVGLTLLGSVALGWHYAVDGYASIVGMLALWWLAGRLTAPHHR